MHKDYDYIIAGGGCAGLSLAYYLSQSRLQHKRILILDTEPKTRNDKTWCFWSDDPEETYTQSQVSWSTLNVHTNEGDYQQFIGPFSYNFVSSLDFYQEKYEAIKKLPQIEFVYERVLALEPLPNGGKVVTDKGTYTASYIFNSVLFPPQRKKEREIFLKQHFYGWYIQTEQSFFNPEEMILMDFRIPQDEEVRFVYVLPVSEHKALIEFTIFSEEEWDKETYKKHLKSYLQTYFPTLEFEIDSEEIGVIPMTNRRFKRKVSDHIINIGTAGGATKATTGYTFRRIQKEAQAIVKSLEEKDNVELLPASSFRFRIYDNLLLYIILKRGHLVRKIFDRLYRKNDFRTILRFLEESTRFHEELWLMIRLPWLPFLRSIKDYYILRKPLPKSPFRSRNAGIHESELS
ncbi:MAG: lycopene cyclase family protein [Bacteroidota bacterium]